VQHCLPRNLAVHRTGHRKPRAAKALQVDGSLALQQERATGPRARVKGVQMCANCSTTETPMWRKLDGVHLCNACGLRLKKRRGGKQQSRDRTEYNKLRKKRRAEARGALVASQSDGGTLLSEGTRAMSSAPAPCRSELGQVEKDLQRVLGLRQKVTDLLAAGAWNPPGTGTALVGHRVFRFVPGMGFRTGVVSGWTPLYYTVAYSGGGTGFMEESELLSHLLPAGIDGERHEVQGGSSEVVLDGHDPSLLSEPSFDGAPPDCSSSPMPHSPLLKQETQELDVKLLLDPILGSPFSGLEPVWVDQQALGALPGFPLCWVTSAKESE